jgi:rifampin ADP-ribosylating transferase
MTAAIGSGTGPFYHGTKARLAPGDLIGPGYASNYGKRAKAAHVYLTETLDAAIWGAELALGEGRGRIYIVEPTGPFEDDPNLTDKKFPGNPTKSYRTRHPLRIIGEVADWTPHPPEQLKAMKDRLQFPTLGPQAVDKILIVVNLGVCKSIFQLTDLRGDCFQPLDDLDAVHAGAPVRLDPHER